MLKTMTNTFPTDFLRKSLHTFFLEISKGNPTAEHRNADRHQKNQRGAATKHENADRH